MNNINTKNLSLEHLVRPAENTQENPPLLLMLHGYGSNEEDLFSFASELPKEYFVISVRAPYNLPQFGYAWFAINFEAEAGKWSDDKQAIQSRDRIVDFIDEACEAYHLDTDNVTLLGFSQGTILSLALALSYPEKVRKVIGLSGYINENLLIKDYQNNDFSRLLMYVSHGTSDQVIPVDWARKTPELLKELNIQHTYEEFPVGHGVSPQNFYSFRNWLINSEK